MAERDVALKSSSQLMDLTKDFEKCDPLVEMSICQEQVALFLEIAYLALKDHPDVAKEVRLSANMSRTQHMMTQGLMKTYVVTSSTILRTMIPLIRKAVQLKKNAILKPMFMKVLKFSEEMRDEAIKTRQSYFELQAKIQKDTADVNTANIETERKQKELDVQERTQEKRRKMAEEHSKKLEKERELKEQELEKLKKSRDEILKKSVPEGSMEVCKEFMNGIMNPDVMDPDPTGVKKAVKGVFGAIGLVITTIKESIEGERAIKASGQVHEYMKHAVQEKDRIDKHIDSAESEKLDSEHKLRMLSIEKASLGDLESLMEASEQLAKVDGQLVNIIVFWDNLAAFLKSLNQKGEVGECFLDAIEDEECAQMFSDELVNVENGWKHFGAVCSRYVERTEMSIPQVYSFLSEPIDKLSIEERKARTKEIIKKIQATVQPKAIEANKS